MTISNAAFVQGIYSHLRDYPEPIDAQTQDALTALAERTFATAEEAGHALAEFVERVQRSDKSGFKKIVQALFNQEMKRLESASAAEEPIEICLRHETGNTKIAILDLTQDPLAHIFSFLDKKSQGRTAQVCRDFRGAMRLRRIYDASPILIQLQPLITSLALNTPEFRALSSLFGISLPSPTPSSSEVSSVCESMEWGRSLLEKVSYILEGVKASRVLSDEEKKPFSTMSAEQIVQPRNGGWDEGKSARF